MPSRIQKLARLFLKFPGIGERQAKRFAFFILSQSPSYVAELQAAISDARAQSNTCQECFRIYEGDGVVCPWCSAPETDRSVLLVVEKQADLEPLEKTSYRGRYFILGGLVPIVEKKVVAETRVRELLERVAKGCAEDILQEVILALPLTPNGEHTDSYLREEIRHAHQGLAITSLGRGLSLGSELEYADPLTIESSIAKRE